MLASLLKAVILVGLYFAVEDGVRLDCYWKMHLPLVYGKVLDVGCNDGRAGAGLLKRSTVIESVYGIDPFLPDSVAIPAQSYDGTTIPFGDNEFDVVLSGFILHHADDPMAVLREMKRVGKRVVVSEDNVDGFLAHFSTLLMHEAMAYTLKMGFQRDGFRTTANWESMFAEVGFHVLAKREYSSCIVLFPFLRHTMFVLVDQDDTEAQQTPVQFYERDMLSSINFFQSVAVAACLWIIGRSFLSPQLPKPAMKKL